MCLCGGITFCLWRLELVSHNKAFFFSQLQSSEFHSNRTKQYDISQANRAMEIQYKVFKIHVWGDNRPNSLRRSLGPFQNYFVLVYFKMDLDGEFIFV